MTIATNKIEPWFIDSDDGTLIHFFRGGDPDIPCVSTPAILYEQNLTPNGCEQLDKGEPIGPINCGAFSITLNATLKITTSEPLPSDFDFVSGSISRFSDRLSMFLEEETPSRIPSEWPILSGNPSQELIRTFITRYDFINVETLGVSSGAPSQALSVSGDKIKTPTKGTPIVLINGARWSIVDNLGTASPEDRVAEYNPTTGTVTFGDGTNGAIPPTGSTIVLKITIRNGGGTWEFAGIVKQPTSDSNLGLVKSTRDKILYGQVQIGAADVSRLTTITSEMDVIVQREVFGATVLNETRYWSLNIGGKASFSGGSAALFRTGIAQTFFAAPGSLLQDVNNYLPGVTVTGGYPSGSFEIAPHSTGAITSVSGLFDPAFLPILHTPGDDSHIGIVTTPDRYIPYLDVTPIIEVWEYIQFFHLVGGDPSPTCVHLESAPFYYQAWFAWSQLMTLIGVHSNGASRSNAANFNRFLRTNRNNKLIEIADKVGTFTSPPIPATDEKWSTHGNFFWRKIQGDSTRHPEWARMVREHKPKDDAYWQHITGTILPGFNLTATATERTVFTLPDIVNTVTTPNGGCLVTNNAGTVGDVRIFGIRNFIGSPPTFIFEPPLPS